MPHPIAGRIRPTRAWQEVHFHLLGRYRSMATQNAQQIDSRLGPGHSHRLERMSASVEQALAGSGDAANRYLPHGARRPQGRA